MEKCLLVDRPVGLGLEKYLLVAVEVLELGVELLVVLVTGIVVFVDIG